MLQLLVWPFLKDSCIIWRISLVADWRTVSVLFSIRVARYIHVFKFKPHPFLTVNSSLKHFPSAYTYVLVSYIAPPLHQPYLLCTVLLSLSPPFPLPMLMCASLGGISGPYLAGDIDQNRWLRLSAHFWLADRRMGLVCSIEKNISIKIFVKYESPDHIWQRHALLVRVFAQKEVSDF